MYDQRAPTDLTRKSDSRTKKATAVGISSGALAAKRIFGVLIPVCFLLADGAIVRQSKRIVKVDACPLVRK